MKRLTFVFCILTLILFLIGCISEQPTETNTPQPKSPDSAPKKFIETPVVHEKLTLNNIIAAYPNKSPDKTLTQLELEERISRKNSSYIEHFPRLSNAYIDPNGIVHALFGGWKGILIDRYAITSYIGPAPDPGPDDVPPPLQNIGLRGGTVLLFPKLADGTTLHEELKSVARNENTYIEIFERPNDHVYPYIKSLPYPVADIRELKKGDPLIFYGSSILRDDEDLAFTPTEKQGRISFVDLEQSLIHIKGSVLAGDYGAPVFSLQCGEKKLVGLIIGALPNGKKINEKESYIIGINEVFRFIEENTKVKIEVTQSSKPCPDYSETANQRVTSAISDGAYDFSYDICALRQCEIEKISPWVRMFENVHVYKDPSYEIVMSEGYAVLVDEYAIVITASRPSLIIPDKPADPKKTKYENKYRIILNGPVYAQYKGETQYEYVESVGIDDSKKVAVFKRANKADNHTISAFPFSLGTSRELKLKNALYMFGLAREIAIVKENPTHKYRQTIDAASVSGFPMNSSDYFYLQGTIDEKDFGAPIFAMRDGNFELVGFIYNLGVLYSNNTEHVGTALTVDFVINAGKEIICKSIGEFKCRMIKIPEPPKKTSPRSPESINDREDILSVFGDKSHSFSSFRENIEHVNYMEYFENERKLTILFYDQTDSRIYDFPALFGEVAIISKDYAITSASLFEPRSREQAPPLLLYTERKDTVMSNILSSNEGKTVEARAIISDNFLTDEDAAELLREIPFLTNLMENLPDDEYWKNLDESNLTRITLQLQNTFSYHGQREFFKEMRDNELDSGALRKILIKDAYQSFFNKIVGKMEILGVVLIDYENGYALLKRQSNSLKSPRQIPIAESENLKPKQETVIIYSQDILTHEAPERIKLISADSITYVSKKFERFIVNGFIPLDNRGAPVFLKRGGKLELIGIISKSYPLFPDQIESEGYGISIDFIFKKIREKTGLDLANIN